MVSEILSTIDSGPIFLPQSSDQTIAAKLMLLTICYTHYHLFAPADTPAFKRLASFPHRGRSTARLSCINLKHSSLSINYTCPSPHSSSQSPFVLLFL